jgi:peptidoglycan/xylan/chitin deacetylase (PgdA/CDA1 family)
MMMGRFATTFIRLARSAHGRFAIPLPLAPRLRATCACLLLAAGCASPPAQPPDTSGATVPTQPPQSTEPPPAHTGVLARNDRFAVLLPRKDDTLASVAHEFLGDANRAWEIAQFNQITHVSPGQAVVVPLQPVNPLGVSAKGYQTVPILCYHRVGPRANLMVMPRETFAAQMEYLAANHYNVIRLADLPDFLSGKRPLPPRAVAITFDDGHVSSYHYAYPILRKHGFAATFFLYTDFLGAAEGLTWPQIHEMAKSGVIDFQSHSKSHANLIVRQNGETDQRYRDRIETELRAPRETIERNLGRKVTQHAFPYGDANQVVLDRLVHTGHQLGLTVNPGGNAFFTYPLMLRRTMIFGASSMESFRSALQVFRDVNLQ